MRKIVKNPVEKRLKMSAKMHKMCEKREKVTKRSKNDVKNVKI